MRVTLLRVLQPPVSVLPCVVLVLPQPCSSLHPNMATTASGRSQKFVIASTTSSTQYSELLEAPDSASTAAKRALAMPVQPYAMKMKQ